MQVQLTRSASTQWPTANSLRLWLCTQVPPPTSSQRPLSFPVLHPVIHANVKLAHPTSVVRTQNMHARPSCDFEARSAHVHSTLVWSTWLLQATPGATTPPGGATTPPGGAPGAPGVPGAPGTPGIPGAPPGVSVTACPMGSAPISQTVLSIAYSRYTPTTPGTPQGPSN